MEIVRSWWATDVCGNVSDTLLQRITVLDTIRPTFNAPNDTTFYKDSDCIALTDTSAAGGPTNVTDNCTSAPTVTYMDSDMTIMCEGSYSFKRTWHVVDECGNERLAVQTITVMDTLKPVITIVSQNDPNGECNPVIEIPTFSLSDNCGGTTSLPEDSVTTTGPTHDGCNYTQTWTATYTDPCGNHADTVRVTYTCTVDTEQPVIATTAESGDKGCNPTIETPMFTYTDNCEGATAIALPSDSVTTAGVEGEGCAKSQTWTATYTDACGNHADTVRVTYTWTEMSTPTITTNLTNVDFLCDPDFEELTVDDFTVTDECNADAVVTLTRTEEVEGQVHNLIWVATYANACGMEAEPDTVIYTWTVAPELSLTCPPDLNMTLAYGDCVMEIYPEQLGNPETAVLVDGDWPFEVNSEVPEENLYYEGETIVTWVFTETVCGTSLSCEQKVNVVFPQCPDAIDCEGNVYHGVRIGCDCWTQTNLLSNCYGDPNECVESGECEDPIPCVYEYESESFPNVDQNVDIYGRLYCAEAALDDSVINEHGHIRGICPEGWYLPTPEKYEELYQYGGGTSILTANGLRSPLYWLDGGGDDATGFRALPAGYYNGAAQQYERMLFDTYFWATEVIHGEVHSTAYKITYDCSEIQRTDIHSGYGISVRCVKEKD